MNEATILERLRKWGIDETKLAEIRKKIKLAKEDFLDSLGRVYCQTCGVLFYEGTTDKFMQKDAIITDFKYLAFRHAWNHPEHKVMVECLVGVFEYSKEVEAFRHRLHSRGDMREYNSCDENARISGMTVACSSCGQTFNDLKEVCYCCLGTKPFLPFQEIENP
jgi:hypothetical protein